MVKWFATAGVLLATGGAIGMPATANAGTFQSMAGVFRRCDFSATTFEPTLGDGRPTADISADGSGQITAVVDLASALPNMHYTARLIQMPRPTLDCSVTGPGVAAGSLDTDGVGAATVTVRGDRLPGTTGAWVFIDRAAYNSQIPAEHYTSDFIAAV